jgi:hypothetical protein
MLEHPKSGKRGGGASVMDDDGVEYRREGTGRVPWLTREADGHRIRFRHVGSYWLVRITPLFADSADCAERVFAWDGSLGEVARRASELIRKGEPRR